jgi:hypothetical protein
MWNKRPVTSTVKRHAVIGVFWLRKRTQISWKPQQAAAIRPRVRAVMMGHRLNAKGQYFEVE